MSKAPNEFLEARRVTAERITGGTPAPASAPRTLPWSEVQTIPDLFQHRTISAEESRLHVQEMARAIKVGPRGAHQDHLAPITVFWVGDAWVCVDGHHRLAAYEWVDHPRPVPVDVLKGATLEQAIHASLRTNSKTQKELSPRCRTEAAWRLELAGGRSKADIAKLVEVDESSIANMRKALREFKEAHPTADPTAFTWTQMRFWRKGMAEPARDGKDANQRRAEQLLRRLDKHLKGVPPEVLLMALDMHRPGMVNELLEAHSGAQESTAYRGLPFPSVPSSAPMNPDF